MSFYPRPEKFQRQPTRAVAGVCIHCGIAIKPGQAYTYRKIIAWEEVPRSGSRGRLTEVEVTGEVACKGCHETQGGTQEGLF